MIWSDGTGASRTSHMSRAVVSQAIDAGFAVASFVPQMHDIRAPAGADATIHSFNFMNLESGRTVFRQQVIDTMVYIRVLRDQLPLQAGVGELDSTRLVYGGHSQGGIVGAMTAGVDPDLVAYVLNGTGSYLSVTVAHRTDPADIAALLSAIMGLSKDRITVEHPLVQLMQLTADSVDPHNYSPYWAGDAERPAGASVFLTNGMLDVTTFPPSIDAMTISGDAAPLAPMGWDPDPIGVWDREAETPPLQGNRQAFDGSDLTTASYLSATTGHPTLHLNPALQAAAVEFWSTALVGVPRVAIP
ncbi:MAG: hypothetical protein CO108_09680 [Deltaproteobacteria bacterium CG_4_9_14_3_um_filter_63_12]|nr:MAG: hypothetical protein CO108_09680 [Deltaproteobacteria bacterium CG_4_9_14_3_um_filter_63_12]